MSDGIPQPLVENAIKQRPDSQDEIDILIRANIEDGLLHLFVANRICIKSYDQLVCRIRNPCTIEDPGIESFHPSEISNRALEHHLAPAARTTIA